MARPLTIPFFLFLLCALAAPAEDAFLRSDVDLDGEENADDLEIALGNFGRSNTTRGNSSEDYITFLDGDVDHDGDVDSDDIDRITDDINKYPNTLPTLPSIRGVQISTSYDPSTRRLTVQDLYGGHAFPLIADTSANNVTVWRPGSGGGSLEPAITCDPLPDGFTLTFSYSNPPSSQPADHGRIAIPSFLFGKGPINSRHFGSDSTESTHRLPAPPPSASSKLVSGSSTTYPRTQYAPLRTYRAVFDDGTGPRTYIVGISVLYPVFEYRHHAEIANNVRFAGQPPQFDLYWNTQLFLNPRVDGEHPPDGLIPPGETRTYRVIVKFFRPETFPVQSVEDFHKNDYLRLFRDYRRFYKTLYGGVTYSRDPRPIKRINVAGGSGCSTSQWGFLAPDVGDPNGNGWRGWTEAADADSDGVADGRMPAEEQRGFERIMLTSPAGFFCSSPFNTPFLFTSNWRNVAAFDPLHPILHTLPDLGLYAEGHAIGSRGGERNLSFWWGRSFQLMDEWNEPNPLLMDFTRTDHQDAAFQEIEGAITHGVETIGMDCISCEHSPWQVYFWLQRLRKEYPSTKFVVEPRNSDFIHTLAPMYYVAYKGENKLIDGPHEIADFLNRGHEKWGSLQTDRNSAGHLVAHPDLDAPCTTSSCEVQDVLRSLADWGFVPHVNASGLIDHGNLHQSPGGLGDLDAKDTYLIDVPNDLW